MNDREQKVCVVSPQSDDPRIVNVPKWEEHDLPSTKEFSEGTTARCGKCGRKFVLDGDGYGTWWRKAWWPW